MNSFNTVMSGFVSLVDRLATAVDDEKIKAIGARAAVDSLTKKRQSEEQLLMAMIAEKRAELERYVMRFPRHFFSAQTCSLVNPIQSHLHLLTRSHTCVCVCRADCKWSRKASRRWSKTRTSLSRRML